MSEGALRRRIPGQAARRALLRRSGAKLAIEAAYDTAAWACGLAVALRSHYVADPAAAAGWLGALGAMCAVPAGAGWLTGLYRSRSERGSFDEAASVVTAAAATAAGFAVVWTWLAPDPWAGPPAAAVAALFALPAMVAARYLVGASRRRPVAQAALGVKIIVFGAGSAGSELVHRLAGQHDPRYRPVALLDDDPAKWRLRIRGVPVVGGRAQIGRAAAETGAKVLVIAIARASGSVIRDLTAEATRCGLVPKVIPSITELLTGGAHIEGVRDPRITDLLNRRPVETDAAAVRARIAGKRVLVTGAGGSIGAELCRQLHRLGPAELIMLDRDESALHAVELALHGRALLDSAETVLADIRDQARIRQIFGRLRPHVVFHAAALKHLPLLERFPAEALQTNVWGTLAVLEAAAGCGVQLLVNVSTDKAADPVSVLGYSKRIAERLTAHVAQRASGTYLSVRFGNVLGSRGSVLTALSAQVAAGGPVTVTHPQVSRYFMTADEAVQLVLQAAVIGRRGEVLVLDMGEPVMIADLARRLTTSTGRDIDIEYTGLRPGEKLAEDLLGTGETATRPCHPGILHAAVPPLDPGEITGLDPGLAADELRGELAARATGRAASTVTVATQKCLPAAAGRAVVAPGHGGIPVSACSIWFCSAWWRCRPPPPVCWRPWRYCSTTARRCCSGRSVPDTKATHSSC